MLLKSLNRLGAWISFGGVNQNDLLHVQEWPLVTVRMYGAIKDIIRIMEIDERAKWNDFCHFEEKYVPFSR